MSRPLARGGASNPSDRFVLIDWICLAAFLTPVAGAIAYNIAHSIVGGF